MEATFEPECDLLVGEIGGGAKFLVNQYPDSIKKTETVIEEESLRYIGDMLQKKFSLKYPHLGELFSNNSECLIWTYMKKGGELYLPSDAFFPDNYYERGF